MRHSFLWRSHLRISAVALCSRFQPNLPKVLARDFVRKEIVMPLGKRMLHISLLSVFLTGACLIASAQECAVLSTGACTSPGARCTADTGVIGRCKTVVLPEEPPDCRCIGGAQPPQTRPYTLECVENYPAGVNDLPNSCDNTD